MEELSTERRTTPGNVSCTPLVVCPTEHDGRITMTVRLQADVSTATDVAALLQRRHTAGLVTDHARRRP